MIPVNESHISHAAPSAGDAPHQSTVTRPRPPEEGPAGPVAAPPRPEAAARPSGWTAGRITALVIGVLLALVALVFLGSGGTVLWADRTQRDAGYVTTDVHEFSTTGSALTTVPTHLGSAGAGWFYAPSLLDKVRIRVAPVSSSSALFVGIGPSAAVDRYLVGVSHTVISDFWANGVEATHGGTPASAPGTQDFWVASSTGPGARTLTWDPANGSWTVVMMNADARPGIDVRADLGARIPALPWIGVGLLVAGAVFAAGGALLIAVAIRRRRQVRTA
jgi:hypothetical protein